MNKLKNEVLGIWVCDENIEEINDILKEFTDKRISLKHDEIVFLDEYGWIEKTDIDDKYIVFKLDNEEILDYRFIDILTFNWLFEK